MTKFLKYAAFIAVCVISAFGIYSLIKTNKIDENTID